MSDGLPRGVAGMSGDEGIEVPPDAWWIEMEPIGRAGRRQTPRRHATPPPPAPVTVVVETVRWYETGWAFLGFIGLMVIGAIAYGVATGWR